MGAWANIAGEYATKRYRSNCINWGIIPFVIKGEPPFGKGDYIFVPGIREAIVQGKDNLRALSIGDSVTEIILSLGALTDDERKIIAAGSLINFYRSELLDQ
jgi:aconitate hydratase